MKRIAIIGAGPAGMTAAYELVKAPNHVKIDLYESSDRVGGLAKTIPLWSQLVDIGPHRFFSSDPRVNQLWLEVVGKDYRMVDRTTRIYYRKRFFDYPLKAFDALKKLGFVESVHCIMSYLRQKINPSKDQTTFEGWVTRRFGRRLYQIFFKSYSEKLWGIPCTELDADFATQRIKSFSLSEALKSAILPKTGTKHKTLVEQFAYPLKGTGSVYESMAKKVVANGGKVILNTGVEKVLTRDNTVTGIILESGKEINYDVVISTMPLSLLVAKLPDTPKSVLAHNDKLQYRNTILVYVKVDNNDLFPDQWLYVHDNSLKLGRITNFRNWVPELNKQDSGSILCLELWCFDDDSIWTATDDIIMGQAVTELRSTGLTKDHAITATLVHRLHRSYPVYDINYKEHLHAVEDYMDTVKNLVAIGRNGSFKYNNQDHSILMGLLVADNILHDKHHNLWEINTDYEYQESSQITATGLQITKDK